MCGFVGYISATPTDGKYLRDARDTLIHRGPDDSRLWLSADKTIGLAHRRLSIIDLSFAGRKPMTNNHKSHWIVFNGEVYNYKEIRLLLESKGYCFTSQTDTEVILKAYAEWGERCLDHFRGMFAFAIYDVKSRSIFFARDRVGKKPLYYFFDGLNFAFASELKALTLFPFFKKKINPLALADYLSLGYIPAPKSIWKNTFKLLPGEFLHYNIVSKAIHKKKYWEPEFHSDESRDEKYWLRGLSEQLYESVRLRTVSDVPVGAFLSGGVDSGIVVAVLSHIARSPQTFTISFQNEKFNESPYAIKVAKTLGCHHVIRNVNTQDAQDIFKQLLWHYDEPFNDYSYFPTYYVCRETAKNVKVALSGDGGDEVFGGYHYYGQINRLYNKNNIISNMIRILSNIGNVFWSDKLKGKNYLKRISKGDNFYLSTASWLSFYERVMMLNVLKDEWIEAIGDYDPAEWLNDKLNRLRKRADDIVGLCRALDFRISLPERMLVKVERASMANSLEVRNPLLDHKFIEFASTIPTRFLFDHRGRGKKIFKKLAEQWIPKECIYREKRGFGPPLNHWFTEGLQQKFIEPFLKGDKQPMFVKPGYLKALLRHQERYNSASKFYQNRINIIQSLAFLENWGDKWL